MKIEEFIRVIRLIRKKEIQRLREIEWIWNAIPFSARMWARIGGASYEWWFHRYVLPVMCKYADPFLRRFLLGDWCERETKHLTQVFNFFAPITLAKPELFAHEIVEFLSGTPPSFAQERSAVRSLLAGKKGYGSFSWYKDETFSQYQKRLNALSQNSVQKKIASVEERDPVQKRSKERVKELHDELVALRARAELAAVALSEVKIFAFTLRFECEEMFNDVLSVEEQLCDLKIEFSRLIGWLQEKSLDIYRDREFREMLDCVERHMKCAAEILSEFEGSKKILRDNIEQQKKELQKKLHLLVRRVDRALLLHPENRLRERQNYLIKAARVLIRSFRVGLKKHPEIPFSMLEQKINQLLDLTDAFYREGKEIDHLSKHLSCLEQEIHRKIETAGKSKKIQNLLDEIESFKNGLEVSVDRNIHFEQISKKCVAIGL